MTKLKALYTLEAMRRVVHYYRAHRLQPLNCPECMYLEEEDFDHEEPPDGYEPMRNAAKLISQCEEHNRPLYPWLHAADTDVAAQWLVKQGNKSKMGFLSVPALMPQWEKAMVDAAS